MVQKLVGSSRKNRLLPFRKRNYPISIKIEFLFFASIFVRNEFRFGSNFCFYRYAVSCPQVRKISRSFHSCISACDWSLILWKNSWRKKQHTTHLDAKPKKKKTGNAIVTLVLLSRSTRCRLWSICFFCCICRCPFVSLAWPFASCTRCRHVEYTFLWIFHFIASHIYFCSAHVDLE